MDREFRLGLEAEVARLRERVHDHATRIRALELRDEQLNGSLERVAASLDSLDTQVGEIVKRGELQNAIAEAVKKERNMMQAERDEARRHILAGISLPYRVAIYLTAVFGAATVVAQSINSLFFG